MKAQFLVGAMLLLSDAALSSDQIDERFPSFCESPPRDCLGPFFKLSQDYPLQLPLTERPWEQYDFRTQPEEYLAALRTYIGEGMAEADWRLEANSVRQWYHMPWMHIGKHPRECLRGMTRERDSSVCELGPLQSCQIQNWGISLYNDYAGYTLGRVWSGDTPSIASAFFPHGAMLVKLLFTEATPLELPFLAESMVWEGNINSTIDIHSTKIVRKLHLLQFDVIIRDPRADDTTGYVFATFMYDKDAPGTTAWDRMMAVGLSWGNDPNLSFKDLCSGACLLEETYICPSAPLQAKERLGWGGRLNGAVDNNQSSCMSCHNTAQWEPVSEMVPKGTPEQRQRWFRNLAPGEAFDAGQQSLGNSLQLMIALKNYFECVAK